MAALGICTAATLLLGVLPDVVMRFGDLSNFTGAIVPGTMPKEPTPRMRDVRDRLVRDVHGRRARRRARLLCVGRACHRRGDFITSPEVGPLFGAVLARAIDTWWNELGRPRGLRRRGSRSWAGHAPRPAILAAHPSALQGQRSASMSPWRSPTFQRTSHPGGVESVAVMPDGPIVGIVIANELIDNLPFRLAVHDGGWGGKHSCSATAIGLLRNCAGSTARSLPSCRPAAFPTAHAPRCKSEPEHEVARSIRPIGAWAAGRHRLRRRPYRGARPAPVARVAPDLSWPRPWLRTI